MVGLVCLVVWGCGPPPDLVTVTPPGVDIPPARTGNDPDAAEAQGEKRATPVLKTDESKSEGDSTKSSDKSASDESVSDETLPVSEPTKVGETRTTSSGLRYETVKEGTGPMVKPGQRVRVHYTGTLDGGKPFDSSRDRDEPFAFVIGTSNVIQGWHEGVSGMRVGEIRKLTIPPELGYGARKRPKIPPNSTLHFEIELLGLQR
jgi:FKBP-type peptidyl-prolyl cis-trans isomerase